MLAETRTVTEPMRPPMSLILHTSSPQSYRQRLEDILINFSNLQDPLSEDLLNWAEKTYKMISTRGFKRNVQLQAEVVKRVHKLCDQKLINPIGSLTFNKPVLERQWTWEEWMLTEYQACWNHVFPQTPALSPFDHQVIQSHCPHKFAQEMQEWAIAILQQIETPDTHHNTISVSNGNPFVIPLSPLQNMNDLQEVKQRLMYYAACAKMYNFKENARATKREMKMAEKEIAQLRIETQERIAQDAVRIDQLVRSHQAELEATLQNIRATHGEREGQLLLQLNQEVNRANQIQVQTQHMLEQEAARENERRRIQREELNRQIGEIEQNHLMVEQNLNSRLVEGERVMQQIQGQNHELSQQLAQTKEQHRIDQEKVEGTINAMIEEHRNRDQLLCSQIAHAQQLLTNVNQQSQSSNTTVQAQQRQINHLNALNQVRVKQIHRLQKKAKKKTFGLF